MRNFLSKHRVDAICPYSFLIQMSLLHLIPKQNEWLNLSIKLVLFPIVKTTVLILERTMCESPSLFTKALKLMLTAKKTLKCFDKKGRSDELGPKRCYS